MSRAAPPLVRLLPPPTFLVQLMGRLPTNTVLFLFWASSSFLALFLCRFSTQCSTPFSSAPHSTSLFFFTFFFEVFFCCSSSSAICRPISLERRDEGEQMVGGVGA